MNDFRQRFSETARTVKPNEPEIWAGMAKSAEYAKKDACEPTGEEDIACGLLQNSLEPHFSKCCGGPYRLDFMQEHSSMPAIPGSCHRPYRRGEAGD